MERHKAIRERIRARGIVDVEGLKEYEAAPSLGPDLGLDDEEELAQARAWAELTNHALDPVEYPEEVGR